MAKPQGLLKISELARAAQVSPSTAKYYVREGLLEVACKTGRNMAYYAPESVERVRLIKTLQTERFYPLSVIRELLSGGVDIREVELLDAIHKSDHADARADITMTEALKRSGVTRADLEALMEAGLVQPKCEGRKRLFSNADCKLMCLARRRAEAGIPLTQTIRAFCAYDAHLRAAAAEDIESLVAEAFLEQSPDTRAIVRLIRTSDETLDEFVALRRCAINRTLGSAQLDRLNAFSAKLADYADALRALMQRHGCTAQAMRLADRTGEGGDALGLYGKLISMNGKGLAYALALCHRAKAFFAEPPAPTDPDGLLCAALCLGFHACAPAALTSAPDAMQLAAFEKSACNGEIARDIVALLCAFTKADEPAP